MVSSQLHYITNREEIFIFSNKKCRIYTVCGVSQTPINKNIQKEKIMMKNEEKKAESIELEDETLSDVTGGKTELTVGDNVLISKYSGTEIKIDGKEYTILP